MFEFTGIAALQYQQQDEDQEVAPQFDRRLRAMKSPFASASMNHVEPRDEPTRYTEEYRRARQCAGQIYRAVVQEYGKWSLRVMVSQGNTQKASPSGRGGATEGTGQDQRDSEQAVGPRVEDLRYSN